MKKNTAAIIAVIAVIVLLIGGTSVSKYNTLTAKEQNVEEQYAKVESKLQRRYDLIPNLVNSVKGQMQQEQEIFTSLADSRAKLAGASDISEKIEASNEIDSALSRLLVVVENYPELKSNENVKALMDELSGTENRISVERDRLAESIADYNRYLKKFPNNLFAGMLGFEKMPQYKAQAGSENAPVVDLKN